MDSLHSFFLLLSVLLYLKQFNIFILIKCLFILNSSAAEQRERGRRGDTFKDFSFDKCSLANDNIMEMDQHCPWNSFLLLFCSKPSLTVAPPDSPSGHNRHLLGRRRRRWMRFIFHSSPYDLSFLLHLLLLGVPPSLAFAAGWPTLSLPLLLTTCTTWSSRLYAMMRTTTMIVHYP